MRKVQCGECGKRYDFDTDDFCPKCGAFNQPLCGTRIGVDGSVIRSDGINEQNHQGSFVHRELHAEDRVRRRTGLEQKPLRTKAQSRPVERNSYQKAKGGSKLPLIVWIILAIIGVNFFSSFLRIFFW